MDNQNFNNSGLVRTIKTSTIRDLIRMRIRAAFTAVQLLRDSTVVIPTDRVARI